MIAKTKESHLVDLRVFIPCFVTSALDFQKAECQRVLRVWKAECQSQSWQLLLARQWCLFSLGSHKGRAPM